MTNVYFFSQFWAKTADKKKLESTNGFSYWADNEELKLELVKIIENKNKQIQIW